MLGGIAYHDSVRFTQYFLHTHERPDRRDIKLEWIQRVIATPLKEIIQRGFQEVADEG